MLNILIKSKNIGHHIEIPEKFELDISNKPLEEQVKLLILRDLLRLNWNVNFKNDEVEVVPPAYYDKETIKQSMAIRRNEIISKNKSWIEKHINFARENLANGYEALNSKIEPIIEVCESQSQHNLFRIFRYYWSSPYSEYVGRRIKLIIRDAAIKKQPVIGIAALGSPIIHIPERDDFIGWDKKTRTKNLVYLMDAYVVGAVPPYNLLLGGKLIAYILVSNEIRKIYREKYENSITLMEKRKAKDLVGIFTTSLYGRSSQYNRLKYQGRLLYQPIGETRGYGTLHLTDETLHFMRKLLEEKRIVIGNNFGDGPSWRMRVIRAAGDILGFDTDFLLHHSFKRKIYYIPLAKNTLEFLNGNAKKPDYYDYPMTDLINFWKERWLNNRKTRLDIVHKVLQFRPESFSVY
ncbi:MAG: hypothetical protein PWQ59_2061 [Thermoanaerobacterium sp.]|nr:hypothetical protein [Thermoanaerobacterium sp.]